MLSSLGPLAKTVPDHADEQVAILHLLLAERVHIPIAGSEILHADAFPAVQLLQRDGYGIPVSAQIGARGTQEDFADRHGHGAPLVRFY
jgi:hypothetical protein